MIRTDGKQTVQGSRLLSLPDAAQMQAITTPTAAPSQSPRRNQSHSIGSYPFPFYFFNSMGGFVLCDTRQDDFFDISQKDGLGVQGRKQGIISDAEVSKRISFS